jgi:secreted Zn-dependent insulinase-like peptidase
LFLDAYPKVLSIIFLYFELLEKSLSDQYHFDETKQMAIINFNNSEKYSPQDYAKTVSRAMNEEYEREHVLSLGVLDWQFDPNHIRDIIRCLTVDNSRIFIASKLVEEVSGNVDWEKEKWFGTEYAKRPLTSTDFSVCAHPFYAKSSITNCYPRLSMMMMLRHFSFLKRTSLSLRRCRSTGTRYWRYVFKGVPRVAILTFDID